MNIIELLTFAHDQHASDLHLAVEHSPMVRIHGKLKKIGTTPLTSSDTENMARKLMNEIQFNRFSSSGEIDFQYSLEGVCRLRVNIFKQKGSIGIVCRLIKVEPPSFEELQIPEVLKQITQQTQGLFLVTGPTGSGKTSTLAAMIDYMNQTMNKHILTLEDPIEFIHPHKKSLVNQREIGEDSQSFSIALRAALRQDPDVILVGEMRDLDTIQTALTAAETGHLVLSTLHTTGAAQTIERIIDVFPGDEQQQIRTQLANTLLGIASQRLIPRAEQTGRIAAFEILINNTGIANLIRSDKVHQIRTLLETGKSEGMQTLVRAVQEYVKKGIVTAKDATDFVPGWDENYN